MKGPSYGYTKELPDVAFADAVARATEALKTEGFGVLTEIDVKATMKKKLDVDVRSQVILGACNPPLAHRAMTLAPFVGLFLPCNVVVAERAEGGSLVSAINPRAMFAAMDDAPEGLGAVADEVDARLRRVIEKV